MLLSKILYHQYIDTPATDVSTTIRHLSSTFHLLHDQQLPLCAIYLYYDATPIRLYHTSYVQKQLQSYSLTLNVTATQLCLGGHLQRLKEHDMSRPVPIMLMRDYSVSVELRTP